MSLSRQDRAALEDLLDVLASRMIRHEDQIRLNELLRYDEEARRAYVQYFSVDAALGSYFSGMPTSGSLNKRFLDDTSSAAFDLFLSQRPDATDVAEVTSFPKDTRGESPVLGFLGSAAQIATNWLSSPKALALTVVGCLATYFLGLMISIAVTRGYVGDRIAQDRVEAPADALARIVTESDCRWQGRAPSAHNDGKLPSGKARLAAGKVELEFAGGARVHIEGPAEFAAKSGQDIELTRGRLLAYVPKQARGFRVSTPTARFVDLGTEFELDVNEQESSEIRVLRGSVAATPRQSIGAAAFGPNSIRLTAGQGLRVSSDSGAPLVLLKSDAAGVFQVESLAPPVVDPKQPIRKITPNQLADLLLWLRADQGVETDADGLVRRWFDRSGNGFTAAQDDVRRRPRRLDDASGSGFPVVAFDGVDDFLDSSSSLGMDMGVDMTFAIVFRVPSSIPSGGIFSLRDKEFADWNSFGGLAFCQGHVGRSLRVVQAECAQYGPPVPNDHDPLSFETTFGDTPLVAMVSKGHGRATLWLNSAPIGVDRYRMQFPADAAHSFDDGFVLGARSDSVDGRLRAGTSTFGNVEIAEVVLYRRALNAEETMQIDQYLSTKYLSGRN